MYKGIYLIVELRLSNTPSLSRSCDYMEIGRNVDCRSSSSTSSIHEFRVCSHGPCLIEDFHRRVLRATTERDMFLGDDGSHSGGQQAEQGERSIHHVRRQGFFDIGIVVAGWWRADMRTL